MIRRLIILLLIVGCVNADVKLKNSDEIGELKKNLSQSIQIINGQLILGYLQLKAALF